MKVDLAPKGENPNRVLCVTEQSHFLPKWRSPPRNEDAYLRAKPVPPARVLACGAKRDSDENIEPGTQNVIMVCPHRLAVLVIDHLTASRTPVVFQFFDRPGHQSSHHSAHRPEYSRRGRFEAMRHEAAVSIG
jgi:hypothetical protein